MFRKRKPVKQLSAEELKSKLYAHFDKSGSLNQMRSEIRGKLVTELFKMVPPPVPSEVEHLSNNFDKTLLPLQVCNWLVYDHLLRQGYQYALSTFVTEAHVPHPERLLTASDILGLFRLDSSTPEYKSISKMYSANNEQGFLHSLLLSVIKSLFDFPTDENVNECMNATDAGISIKEASGGDPPFVPSEIPKFSRESFTRPRNKSADFSFQAQLQSLKEEKEKEIQALRQKWLEELDRLHSQERSMKEEIENKRREVQRELDGILEQKEKSKEREFLLIKEYENKLEKKIRDLETDYLSKIHSKESDLKISQGKLYDKELRVAQVEADFASLQTNFHSLKRESEEIKETYKLTKEKYSALLDENTKLLRKFESMSDYTVLKVDLEACSKEVSGLHQELDENKRAAEKEKDALLEKIRSLETKLKHKESQLSEVQRQLNLCRDTMHREEAIWHKERRKLEQDSQESKEMYKTLIRRLEEQRDDIQALHHTIHILHYQLTDTDKRNHTKQDTLVPQRTEAKYLDNRKINGSFLLSKNAKDSSKYNDDSLKFIEEAKGRIKNLEKEADTLRDKCSAVFYHTPSLQDIHGHKTTTTPSVFKVSNVPNTTFSSQSFNDRFETLIRNEMPTLDSCLQTQAKNQLINVSADLHFLKTTDTKMYSPDIFKSLELDGNKVMPFSNLSSLNLYQQDLAPKNVDNPSHDLKVDDSSRNKGNSEMACSGQQSGPSSDSDAKTIEQNLKSGQINAQNKPKIVPLTENALLHPETHETSKTNTVLLNPKSNIHIPSFDYSIQAPQSIASSVTNSIQSQENYAIEAEKKSNTTESVEDDISQKTESSLKDNSVSSFKDDTVSKPEPPIVIDLDSAWKRKTSLKDDSESQSVPSILSGIDSMWKRRTSLVTSTHSLLKSNVSTQLEEEREKGSKISFGVEREQISDENSTNSPLKSSSDARVVGTEKENADSNKTDQQDQKNIQEPKTPVVSIDGDEAKTDETKLPSSEMFENTKEKTDDAFTEKQILEEGVQIPEDSLSEPSDMHLSCGSEQEQQKEDSDNW